MDYDFPVPTGYAGTATTGQYNPTAAPPTYDNGNLRVGRQAYNMAPCTRDNHFFECRHELTCYCGATTRTQAVDIPAGL